MSVRAIAREFGVAQSSVSVWVRDVAVPPPPEPPPPEPVRLDPEMKFCGRCRRPRSLSHFNRAGDGHQHRCRDCFREYFRQRGSVHREQSNAARVKRINAAQTFVREYLSEHVCVDCGEDEIAVLEFDHVGEKTAEVARLMNTGQISKLRREMQNCEVVCGCCHRRRTAARAGWARATGAYSRTSNPMRERNLRHIVDVLTFGGCVDCGERDPIVLEFDHVGRKRANISKLVDAASLQRLKEEIAECEVRCANCHRMVTLARHGGSWRDAQDWSDDGYVLPAPVV
jgi:predicted transcriptional regulator